MKVLYISYDGMTDPLGQSQVIPYLKGLSKKGHEIHILSAEKPEPYKLYNKFISKILDNDSIAWHPIQYTKKPPVISTIKDIFKLKLEAKKLHKENGFDAVHCRSYISAFAGNYLKKKFGVKFIFDIRGFFADERIDGDIWDKNKIVYNKIYSYFKKKEIEFFNNADHTISLTENGKKEIHSWKNISNQPIPITVIPCCVDIEHFKEGKIDLVKKLDYINWFKITPDDFVISYLGSVGTWYMLDEMMAFFSRLLVHKPSAKFLFITPDKKEDIIKIAKKFNVSEDKLYVIKAQRNEVPILLSISKLSLFFIKPVYSKKASSPTKMGEIMSLGIPIICNSNVGDVDTIMEKSNAGIVVNNFTDKDYDEAIYKIDSVLEIPKEDIREKAIEFYSLENGVERYCEVYDILLGV